jgi:hypothetical protein
MRAFGELPSLKLRFVVSGKSFWITKTNLYEKLGLFRLDASLLNLEFYRVKTRVPGDVFDAFVRMVEGGEIKVSEENRKSFQDLSDEFGFQALADKCAARTAVDSALEAQAQRIRDLEEASLFHERGLAMAQDSVRSLISKVGSLEAEIRQICDYCSRLREWVSEYVQGVERERESHAGAEYVEMSSGQIRGQEVSGDTVFETEDAWSDSRAPSFGQRGTGEEQLAEGSPVAPLMSPWDRYAQVNRWPQTAAGQFNSTSEGPGQVPPPTPSQRRATETGMRNAHQGITGKRVRIRVTRCGRDMYEGDVSSLATPQEILEFWQRMSGQTQQNALASAYSFTRNGLPYSTPLDPWDRVDIRGNSQQ